MVRGWRVTQGASLFKEKEKVLKKKRKKKRVSIQLSLSPQGSIIHVYVQYVSHYVHSQELTAHSVSKCGYSGKPPYVPRQSSLEVMRSDSI